MGQFATQDSRDQGGLTAVLKQRVDRQGDRDGEIGGRGASGEQPDHHDAAAHV